MWKVTGRHGHQEAGLTGVHPECSDKVIPLKSLPTGKEGNNTGTEKGGAKEAEEGERKQEEGEEEEEGGDTVKEGGREGGGDW